MVDAIISIKPRHVDNILAGKKTVELRVRKINLPIGSRLWIYTTLPIGKVRLSAEVAFIESLSPKDMWIKYGKDICIPKDEFDEYTRLRDVVVAVGLQNVRALDKEVCLETMRRHESGFQPPQFFLKLNPDRALYSVFYKNF